VQLGSIELLYVNAQAMHKVKITKRAARRRIMQSVLALLEKRLVSSLLHEGCPPKAPCLRAVLEPIWYVMHEY
jgi:hypothetical protein